MRKTNYVMQKKRKTGSALDGILFFLELMTVMQPSSINKISPWIFQGLLIVFVMLEGTWLFFHLRGTTRVFTVENGILVFTGFQLMITLLLHSSPLIASLKYPLSVLLTVLCVMRRLRTDRDRAIHQIAVSFFIIIAVNAASIAVFPSGLYKNISPSGTWQTAYFLGVDNQFGKILFPGMALIWFDEQHRTGNTKKCSLITFTALVMVSFSYIFIKNGTGMISLFFLYVLFFMYYYVHINKKAFIILFIAAVSIVMLYLILEAAAANSNSFFMAFVANLLGKTPDFSGRSSIWNAVLRSVLHRPLLGHGQQPDDVTARVHGMYYNSHNKLLQTLFECGLTGTVLLVATVVLAIKEGRKHLDQTPEIMTLFVGVFITGIYFMMEVGTFTPFFILLLVMAYSQSLSVYNQLNLRLGRKLPVGLIDL